MPAKPANLRLLSILVAGAFAVSGCVTTYTVVPARLIPVVGLPENQEAELLTTEGLQTVTGATRVTLRSTEGTRVQWTTYQNSREGEATTTHEVRLSWLRSEAGALVLSETGQTLALNNIWSAEFTKGSPSKTGGLVAAIIVGTAILALATLGVAFFVAAGSSNNGG
jgi:hypothetical protein